MLLDNILTENTTKKLIILNETTFIYYVLSWPNNEEAMAVELIIIVWLKCYLTDHTIIYGFLLPTVRAIGKRVKADNH